MTQEEKAKAYDRALEIAKAWRKLDNNDLSNDDLETLFPELKESEGEKTRKRIIALVNAHGQGMYKEDMLSWLEKQGKTVLSEETDDDAWINDIISKVENNLQLNKAEIDWLKSLKNKYTWKPSDEQIKAIRLARSFVTDDFDEHPALSEILNRIGKTIKETKGGINGYL